MQHNLMTAPAIHRAFMLFAAAALVVPLYGVAIRRLTNPGMDLTQLRQRQSRESMTLLSARYLFMLVTLLFQAEPLSPRALA